MIPYWAFGYHQSRWGYDSIEKLNYVYNNFTQKGLPFDAIWLDIDYMKDGENFVVDWKRYH